MASPHQNTGQKKVNGLNNTFVILYSDHERLVHFVSMMESPIQADPVPQPPSNGNQADKNKGDVNGMLILLFIHAKIL